MKIVTAVLVFFILASIGNAQTTRAVPPKPEPLSFKSGNDLLHDCQQPEMSSAGICMGYILGVLDMINTEQNSGNIEARLPKDEVVCLPQTIDAWQVRDVVKKYLVDHPEERNLHAAQVVWKAVTKAWGCPAK
jgi:Rap1a immunity proteins